MTREDCKKLLMIIDASYPNFKVENASDTLDAWFYLLQDYEFNQIAIGLKVYIATSGSAFAPSVSELIAASNKPKQLIDSDVNATWTAVRKAIRRSAYDSVEEFEKLPDEAKKIVGNPAQLHSWSQMTSESIDTVVASNFRRSFDAITKRNAEIAALPENVRALIQTTMQNKIEKKGGE